MEAIRSLQLDASKGRGGGLLSICHRGPFGLWGAYGQPNVAWGNYARFVHYTAELNWFLPAAMISVLAIIATAAETLFGLLLVLGWKTQATEPASNRYRSLSSPFLLDELRSRGKLLEISDRSELLRDRTFTANEFLAHERVKEMRSTSAFKSLLHRIILFGPSPPLPAF